MTLQYEAAVLHAAGAALAIERVEAVGLAPHDVLVRVRAAGLCHTDLEVIEGSLRYPMPIVLGHEAAGVVEAVGSAVTKPRVGDHVVLSWNPHCGHCFYCDRGLPILCEPYLAKGPQAVQFDGQCKARRVDGGGELRHLMFLGAFGDYCIVQDQQAIAVPNDIPFDRACLIGCGVMTGVGAALNVARIGRADTVMIVGCGAVGLSAVQGARLAGAARIVAVDLDDKKLALARRMGATDTVNAKIEDALDVAKDVAFRWGALMQEKRLRRSSYGEARPARDFPLLAQAYLDGRLMLDEMITARIALGAINEGFAALRNGEAIRSVVMFDQANAPAARRI